MVSILLFAMMFLIKGDITITHLSRHILTLTIDVNIYLIPDYHTVKPSCKRFSLLFPKYQKKFVNTSKNQSIITKKLNLIFWEKSHQALLWFGRDLVYTKDCLVDIIRVTSKLTGVKSIK